LALIEKKDDGSTRDELVATAMIFAGVLVGIYAFCAYWIMG
jgi:hypothetical protein